METVKQCSRCNEVKPLTEYHKSKTCKFGVTAECKVCLSVRRKRYYNNNKDREIARVVDYNTTYIKQRHANDTAYALRCNLREAGLTKR